MKKVNIGQMRMGYTLAPAASPITLNDLGNGARGLLDDSRFANIFKAELEAFFGARHVSLWSSGRAALVLGLKALQELAPKRHKVIIPAFTCWSVPAAIVRAGLTVVPCDTQEASFDYDFSSLRGLLGPDVLGVITQHLFGVPAEVDRLRRLLTGTGIFLIEDAAQAMGGRAQGNFLGTRGDIGLFSLSKGKNLSTVTGGILMTNNGDIARSIGRVTGEVSLPSLHEKTSLFLKALVMAIFLDPRLYWIPASAPGVRLGETIFDPGFPIRKLSGMQAGLARSWGPKLEAFRQARRHNTLMLLEGIQGLQVACPLSSESAGNGPRLPLFIAETDYREGILAAGRRHGLGIARTYPDAVDGIPYFRQAPWRHSFPRAQKLARETITLPIHPLVSPQDLQRLIGLVKSI